jgi:hypothetical protein
MSAYIDFFFDGGSKSKAASAEQKVEEEPPPSESAKIDEESNQSDTAEEILEEVAPANTPETIIEEVAPANAAEDMPEEAAPANTSENILEEADGMQEEAAESAAPDLAFRPGESVEITVAGSAPPDVDTSGRTYKCFIQTTVYTREDVRKHNYLPCIMLREDMQELVHKFTPRNVYLEHCTTRPPVGKWTRVWMEVFEGIEVLRGEIFFDMKTEASRRIVQKIERAGGANLSVQVDFHAGYDSMGRATQRLARIHEISVVERPDFGAAFITTAAGADGAAADFDPEMCLTLDSPLVVTDPEMENMQTEPPAAINDGEDVQNVQNVQNEAPSQTDKAPQSESNDFERIVQQSIARIMDVNKLAEKATQTIGEDASQFRSMSDQLSKNPSLFNDAAFMQQMEEERKIVERMCEREMKRASQAKPAAGTQAPQQTQSTKRPLTDLRTPSPSEQERALNKNFHNPGARLQNAGPAYTSRTGGPPPSESVSHPIPPPAQMAYANLDDFVRALLSAAPDQYKAEMVPISVPLKQHYKGLMENSPISRDGTSTDVVRVAGSFYVNGNVDDMYNAYMNTKK